MSNAGDQVAERPQPFVRRACPDHDWRIAAAPVARTEEAPGSGSQQQAAGLSWSSLQEVHCPRHTSSWPVGRGDSLKPNERASEAFSSAFRPRGLIAIRPIDMPNALNLAALILDPSNAWSLTDLNKAQRVESSGSGSVNR